MRACLTWAGVVSFREAPDWTLADRPLVWGVVGFDWNVCGGLCGYDMYTGEEGVHCVDETRLDSDKL